MSQEALHQLAGADPDQPLPDNLTPTPYVPVFNPMVRTIVYCVALLASLVGTVLLIWGGAHNNLDQALAGGIIDAVGGLLASGFGVAYNPSRTTL